MKIKVLLSSVLSIVLCLTMIAGATYALFTDSETVNIAVTAGKVDIDVTATDLNTLSYPKLVANNEWTPATEENGTKGYFTNGGTATYVKDAATVKNELTLDKITPGDAVKVTLAIDNKSDVNIKYRVKVGMVEGVELFKALNVSIGGVSSDYNGMTFVSDWVDLAPTDNDPASVELVIELPYLSESQNDLMGKKTQLYYTVQAVQGNASAEDLDAVEAGTTYIYNAIDLELFAENVNNGYSYAGETVQLMSDVDLGNMAWTPINGFKGTLDGKKTALTSSATDTLAATTSTESTETTALDTYVIKNFSITGVESVGFFGAIRSPLTIKNVTFENVTVYGNHFVGVVFGWEGAETTNTVIENVHVTKSSVTCAPEETKNGWDNGDKAGAIGGYAVTVAIKGCTVAETEISAYRDLGGVLGCANSGSCAVSGCAIENVTLNVNSTYNYKNYTSPVEFDANSIVGEAVATAKIEGNDGEATIAKYTLDGVKYFSEGNEFVLDDAAAFTGNVYNIPEGVTTIDLKAFQKMTNLKNVTFPSTLKTVVNAAFLQSGLESVVIPGHVELQERLDGKSLANTFASCKSLTSVTLEEGITYLPSGCFQECYALKSVTIPSTVTSLAKKAFYDCLDLESVYLLSENCTIGAQAFGSNQTGKFSNMTIYVVNEAMKAAVEATLTDNNKNSVTVKLIGEQITPDESNPDAAQNALNAAVSEEGATVYVNAGEYTFPAGKIAEGVTLICAEGTVFEGASAMNINGATVVGGNFSNPGGSAGTSTVNGTYKDCTFYGSNGLRWCYAGDTVVFENCVFDGSVYGVHFDGGANKVKFVNCTISGFNTMGGAIEMLTMEGCTFKANGRSGYNGINLWGDTKMTNCTFVFDGSASTEWIDLCGDNKTATFTNCVVTDGTTEKDIATVIGDYGTGNTIIIDGAQVVTTTDALVAAINSNATKVLLAEGEYALRFTNNTAFNVDGMTIIGIGNVKISISSSEVWYGRIQGDDVTFENITFTSSVGCTGKATYNNCTFNGDWAICASSGMKETYFNDCTINATLNTSTDFSSGNVYVKNCTITKAEYSAPAATTLYFENSTIGELITWNANTVLTGCTVTTLDDSHMTTGTITIK